MTFHGNGKFSDSLQKQEGILCRKKGKKQIFHFAETRGEYTLICINFYSEKKNLYFCVDFSTYSYWDNYSNRNKKIK